MFNFLKDKINNLFDFKLNQVEKKYIFENKKFKIIKQDLFSENILFVAPQNYYSVLIYKTIIL